MQSPGFSKFRHFMDLWDDMVSEEETSSRIKELVDSRDFVMYVLKDKEVFGCPEDSRLVFAKLRHPDDETPEGWSDEASFMAYNLSKEIEGNAYYTLFSKDDLKKIKVIDKEKAIKLLDKKATDLGEKAFPKNGVTVDNPVRIVGIGGNRDDAPNFIHPQER